MQTIIKYTRSAVVAVTNICLSCGAGYVLDWAGHLIRKTVNAPGAVRRLVHIRLLRAYRQQVNALKQNL
jgi:hypothetical protein